MQSKNKKKILFIEDNIVVQTLTGFLINRLGYIPILLEDPNDLISKLHIEKPDLVITDVNLSESCRVSGVELCRRIKTNNDLKHIPVMLFSSFSSETDRMLATKYSMCDGSLSKPLRLDLFKAMVEKLLVA